MADHPLYRDGQVVSVDPVSGTRTVYRDIDDKYGVLVTERFDDQDIIEDNRALRQIYDGSRFGDMAHVASVPMNVAEDQLMEAIRQYDHKYICDWLNRRDNQAWRVRDGRV